MKVKTKTPDRMAVSFNRREMMIIVNCLNEACHGLTMDRFLPAHEELLRMLKDMDGIMGQHDFFRLKPIPA